jgi:hypothetical protein
MLLGRPRQLAEDIGFFHFKDFRHSSSAELKSALSKS